MIDAVAFTWLAPSRAPVAAQHACAGAYETATSATAASASGQGVLQKLNTKVVNAWRMLTRAEISEAIAAFRQCLASGQPPATATLTVRTLLLDETAPNQVGAAAGAGVYIRVDGATIGQTGDDGTLTAPVPSGAILVQAIVPSFYVL